MRDYNTIEELFEKTESGKYKEWAIKDPTVEYLASNSWDWTKFNEGIKTIIHWDGGKVSYENVGSYASPCNFEDSLTFVFLSEHAKEMFKLLFKDKDTYLFGTCVYRAYREYPFPRFPLESFELEDVKVDGAYLPREGVETVGRAFAVDRVAVLGHGTLKQAVLYVKTHPETNVICRPSHEMRNEKGDRVIVRVMYDGFKLQNET